MLFQRPQEIMKKVSNLRPGFKRDALLATPRPGDPPGTPPAIFHDFSCFRLPRRRHKRIGSIFACFWSPKWKTSEIMKQGSPASLTNTSPGTLNKYVHRKNVSLEIPQPNPQPYILQSASLLGGRHEPEALKSAAPKGHGRAELLRKQLQKSADTGPPAHAAQRRLFSTW